MPGKTQGMYKQLHDRSFPEHRCVIRIINQLEPSQICPGKRRECTNSYMTGVKSRADVHPNHKSIRTMQMRCGWRRERTEVT